MLNPLAHAKQMIVISFEYLERREIAMLWTIFVILLVLWLVGVVSFHAIGAYIHILLVIALVILLIQLINGRRSV